MKSKGWKMLGIIALIGLLAIGFVGCVEEKKVVTQKPELTPIPTPTATPVMTALAERKIEFQPIVEATRVYLRVNVTWMPETLKLELFDPNGSRIDVKYVSKDDLGDGNETVKLNIWEIGEDSKPGTYSLLVKDPKGKIVYNSTITFEKGAKLRIEDVLIEDITYVGGVVNRYYISKMRLFLSNNGDLPAFIDKAVLLVDGKKTEKDLFLGIPPIEVKEIKLYSTKLSSGLESGKYTLTIKLYSHEGCELASYKTELMLSE